MMTALQKPDKAGTLFGDWPETLIWSCLQQTMGRVYADDAEHPRSVLAMLGDFGFLAGHPNQELALFAPAVCGKSVLILVPQNNAWAAVIERGYGENARRVTRYATKKEPDAFDRERLRHFVQSLPPGYTLKPLDEERYRRCQSIGWCREWVAQYPDYAAYRAHGLGVVIEQNGEPVAGASAYSHYRSGIEIQIDTQEDFRRRGLATAAGAALILRCLDRGLYPSWDAQNKHSLALAEKLGYHAAQPYTAYEIEKWKGETDRGV